MCWGWHICCTQASNKSMQTSCHSCLVASTLLMHIGWGCLHWSVQQENAYIMLPLSHCPHLTHACRLRMFALKRPARACIHHLSSMVTLLMHVSWGCLHSGVQQEHACIISAAWCHCLHLTHACRLIMPFTVAVQQNHAYMISLLSHFQNSTLACRLSMLLTVAACRHVHELSAYHAHQVKCLGFWAMCIQCPMDHHIGSHMTLHREPFRVWYSAQRTSIKWFICSKFTSSRCFILAKVLAI